MRYNQIQIIYYKNLIIYNSVCIKKFNKMIIYKICIIEDQLNRYMITLYLLKIININAINI